jgi:hypothetical protein
MMLNNPNSKLLAVIASPRLVRHNKTHCMTAFSFSDFSSSFHSLGSSILLCCSSLRG